MQGGSFWGPSMGHCLLQTFESLMTASSGTLLLKFRDILMGLQETVSLLMCARTQPANFNY